MTINTKRNLSPNANNARLCRWFDICELARQAGITKVEAARTLRQPEGGGSKFAR